MKATFILKNLWAFCRRLAFEDIVKKHERKILRLLKTDFIESNLSKIYTHKIVRWIAVKPLFTARLKREKHSTYWLDWLTVQIRFNFFTFRHFWFASLTKLYFAIYKSAIRLRGFICINYFSFTSYKYTQGISHWIYQPTPVISETDKSMLMEYHQNIVYIL